MGESHEQPKKPEGDFEPTLGPAPVTPEAKAAKPNPGRDRVAPPLRPGEESLGAAPVEEDKGEIDFRPDVLGRARGEAPASQDSSATPVEEENNLSIDQLIDASPLLADIFKDKSISDAEKAETKKFIGELINADASPEQLLEEATQLGIAREYLPTLLKGKGVSEEKIAEVMKGMDSLKPEQEAMPPGPLASYQEAEEKFEKWKADPERDESPEALGGLIDMIKSGANELDQEAVAAPDRSSRGEIDSKWKRKLAFGLLAAIVIAYFAGLSKLATTVSNAGGKG